MSVVSAGGQALAPQLHPGRMQTRQRPIVDSNETISFHVLLQECLPGKASASATPFLACGVFGRNLNTSDMHPVCPADDLTLRPAGRLCVDSGNSQADLELWTERDPLSDFARGSAERWRAFEETSGYRCTSATQTSGKSRNSAAFVVAEKALHQANAAGVDQIGDAGLQSSDHAAAADSNAGPSRGRLRFSAQGTLLQPATGHNTPVMIAVHALDGGLRVYVRVGANELRGRENLENAVRATLADHGLAGAEIVIELNGVAHGNSQQERA